MKSYNHLFEQLISRENILRAIGCSSKRKHKRKEVTYILNNKEDIVRKIQDLLINNKFKPQKHNLTEIFDKSSKKKRLIVKPYYFRNMEGEEVYEQIIHHAVVQVLEPIFMKGMYKYSCGSIPKRGGLYGKRYIEKFIREHKDKDYKYCCKFDIRHFYESVSTDLLKEKFKKIIHDKRMLDVIFAIIDSNEVYYKGESQKKGLLIGFYPSQWFANWFMQDFDHFVKEELKIKCYVRYVDDIILLAPNKKELHKTFQRIIEYLSDMDLTLKKNYQIFKFIYESKNSVRGRPIDYMGFKFYRNRTTLRKTILRSSTRKARKIFNKNQPTHLDASQILSYLGWYKRTNTHRYYIKNIASKVNINMCKKLISRNSKKETKNGKLETG